MEGKTIAQSLEKKRTLIFNSSKPEVLPYLEKMGINKEYLSTGKNLYNEALDSIETQKKESQEEALAYDVFYDAKAACHASTRDNRKIIKMASRKDKDLQNRIGIYSFKERNIEPWINQTIEFYNLVLNETEFLPVIARFGLTKEKLTEEKNAMENLKVLRNETKAESGQAQEATRLKNNKMEELEDYYYELKTIASIALKEKPQLLEMLGIRVA